MAKRERRTAQPHPGHQWAYRHTFTSNAKHTAALAPWLEDTCSYDGRQYGSSLGAEVATTLLPLITRAGLGEYAVQEIVTGIATVHPELVLDYLLELGNGDGPIPAVIHKLSGAFDDHAETFAGWVHEHLDQDTTTIGHVLNAAANHHLTENHRERSRQPLREPHRSQAHGPPRLPRPAHALGVQPAPVRSGGSRNATRTRNQHRSRSPRESPAPERNESPRSGTTPEMLPRRPPSKLSTTTYGPSFWLLKTVSGRTSTRRPKITGEKETRTGRQSRQAF